MAEEKQFYEEQLAGITEAAISSPKVRIALCIYLDAHGSVPKVSAKCSESAVLVLKVCPSLFMTLTELILVPRDVKTAEARMLNMSG